MRGAIAAVLLALAACGGPSGPRPRGIYHEYDGLLTARTPSHDEFGLRAGQGPPDVTLELRALHEDSRPEIRVIALSKVAQAQAEHAIPEYIAALEDPADEVFAEAAHELAAYGSGYMDRDESPEALAALRAHVTRLRALANPNAETYDVASVGGGTEQALRFIAEREGR